MFNPKFSLLRNLGVPRAPMQFRKKEIPLPDVSLTEWSSGYSASLMERVPGSASKELGPGVGLDLTAD